VPHFTNLRVVFEIVYLEAVVQGIISTLRSRLKRRPTYLNHTGDVLVPFMQLREYLERDFGMQLNEVKMRQWVSKAQEVGMSRLLVEVFKQVENGDPTTFPKLECHKKKILRGLSL
jgi:hypothetical protein